MPKGKLRIYGRDRLDAVFLGLSFGAALFCVDFCLYLFRRLKGCRRLGKELKKNNFRVSKKVRLCYNTPVNTVVLKKCVPGHGRASVCRDLCGSPAVTRVDI